ncbi:carbonic anhydrase 2-like [Amphibalanus amphitrite]|uniref:carbonic anhydrase 2-like n=1 Tax=Amphibalanus amphitrite TaxID=1232801 RepID=UPI001C9290AE|nr:carbonic anhydrase 2-like [Amphibalanus amphitrite]
MSLLSLLLLAVTALLPATAQPAASEPSWSYADQSSWSAQSPQCAQDRQSPVSLETSEVRDWGDGGRPQLSFAKDLKAGQLTASNTGRTLKVTLRDASDQPAVQLKGAQPGPVSGLYTMDHMHLHWNDPAGGRGSEHKMNGAFEQAEAHFVFFNQKYGSVSAALEHTDGLAVLGLLLRPDAALGPTLPTLGLDGDLSQLSQLSSHLSRLADLRPLRGLLRAAVRGLFSYEGSLTTPPCSRVVTWLVSDRPVSVEATFLEQLRTSLSADAAGNETIQNNWRELQPLNGRTVVRYTDQDPQQ